MESFIIKNRLTTLLIKALLLEEEEFDSSRKLVDYGMDSITGVEFVKSINQEFLLNLSATEIYDYPTINELITLVTSHLPEKQESIIESKSNIAKPNSASLKSSKNSGYLVKTNQTLSGTYFEKVTLDPPNRGEVQIAVKASSINFPDIMCVRGIYPTMPSYPFVPGFEVSGIIEKLGEGVPSSFLGKEVIALTGEQMGGHAHYVNVSVENLIRKPVNLTHEQACSLPIVFGTTYYALKKAELKDSENILIQTATGGCGLMAVQLTNLLGATPIGTSSKKRKLEFLESIGVNYQGNYASADFEESMLYMSNDRGFDVILNMLSGQMIQTGLNLLGSMGRYIELAVHGLRASAKLDLSGLIDNQVFRSIDLRRMLRSENEQQLLELQESFAKMVMLVEQNYITPIVSRVYPLSMIGEAMSYVESGKHIGKVVISHTATEMIDYEEDLQQNLKNQKEKAISKYIDVFEEVKKAAPVSKNNSEVILGNTDIAIIGISAQMPGSRTKEEFWENLKKGVNSVKEVPENRWKKSEYYSEDITLKGKSYSKWMGTLEGVDEFDPLFFNISPHEAELMDPQHRLWLEEGWKVIEDAGYSPEAIAKYKCGVFIGVGSGDYASDIKNDAIEDHLTLTGNSSSIISARLSYLLNLKGPSMAIDTACSSSLVAIAQACDSIVLGNSEIALAGGVCVMSTPQMHIQASKARMLSKDGKCHTFDQQANGFVPGEGVGVLLLKRLDEAKKDSDQIYGIIKGWGVNQDGATNGITAPSKESQVKLQTEIYNKFNIAPESLSYIEAHGTGTKLGDPIEIEALIKTHNQYTSKIGSCGIGSVKTNIGHALTAAGVSGAIKVLLQMKHKQLAPSINYNKLNEHISLKGSPFYINTKLKNWDTEGNQPRKAAVSSFGFSGTNAHLVIEEYIQEPTHYKNNDSSIILLSAKNKERLKDQADNLVTFLEENKDASLYNIAYTLQVGRENMEQRLALVVKDKKELKEQLIKFIKGETGDFLIGNSKKDKNDFLLEGEAGEAYIQTAISKQQINALAQLWIKGVVIDWNLFYKTNRPNKISLPTYPFARERYWISKTKGEDLKTVSTQIEPFLDNNTANSLEQSSEEPSLVLYKNTWDKYSIIESENLVYSDSLILLAGGSASLADALKEALGEEVLAIDEDDEISYYQCINDIIQSKLTSKEAIRIQLIYRNSEYVDYGFISGFLKTVEIEESKLICKTLGVDSLSIKALEDITTIIKSEASDANLDKEVRYIENDREVRRLSTFSNSSEREKAIKIKLNGVYLITGGCGGLGHIFANHINKTKGTQLILTGRSAKSSLSKKELKSLNAVYYQCDITSKKAVTTLIQRIIKSHKRIDGILHSAGVLKDSFLRDKTRKEAALVLSPKILGAKYLDNATKAISLDFMVYFSSVAGVMGNIGQADYSAANAWMDNYASYRNDLCSKGKRKGKTLSINWPLWADGGMQIGEEKESHIKQKRGMIPLPTLEGVKIIDNINLLSENQLIVAYGYPSKLSKKLVTTIVKLKEKVTENRIDISVLERQVTVDMITIISKMLKLDIKDINIEVELGDYGFDSILLTKLSNKINESYDLEIMPTLFYNYPSIGELVAYLLEEYLDNLQNKHKIVLKEVTETSKTISDNPLIASENLELKKLITAKGIQNKPDKGVAIVGMSGRFPGSPDLETFWKNIRDNKDLIIEVPKDRWDWRQHYGNPKSDSGKTKAKWGGFINDIDKFDPLFFGISPLEAELMDPQQRITLETVYAGLEDAGLSKKAIKGSNTGVFVGVSSSDYSMALSEQKELLNQAHFPTGASHSVLVNRISYLLDLHGPSEPIDTACSSSLIAIHRAVENINNGHCDVAIAGGVNVLLSLETTLALSQAGMLSEDGRCKTFDQNANGYVRGEGVGIVILKSLALAEADGDHIYGVIKGTAENHGGKANTLTSPNPKAQRDLLLNAYRSSGIDPKDVGYIEAHGTGTSLGDPIEIEGLKLAFKELYKEHNYNISEIPSCGIGSVKTNIGHLEAGAGIAGVMKVLLSLKHKTLPGNVHLETPNEYLQLKNTPFYLQKETKAWETVDNKPRIAGVSSFGFGGANAHIVIEEYLQNDKINYNSNTPAIIIVSGANENRLKDQVDNLLSFLETNSDINIYDLAYTLQIGRDAMEERLAFIASDVEEIKTKLSNYKEGKTEDLFSANTKKEKHNFVLKGNAGKLYIETIIKDKESENLAQLWVQGIYIDWNLLYENDTPNKISLPTYPFAREHYWIPEPITQEEVISGKQLHPLLHSNISDLSEQKYQSTYTGKESFLLDHKIQGEKVIPGVAYLELAREAGALGIHKPITQLSEIRWLDPFYVNGKPKQIEISLFAKNNGIGYQIHSNSDETEVIHGEGRLSTNTIPKIADFDIQKLRASLTQEKSGIDCYKSFKALGLDYGKSFQGIDTLYYNSEASLSKVKLAKEKDYLLQPGLLDCALQTCIGLSLGEEEKEVLKTPFNVGEVNIYGDVSTTTWCYAQKSANHKLDSEFLSYDIDLLNEEGEVLLSFIDFTFLPRAKDIKQDTKEIPSTYFYNNDWMVSPEIETQELCDIELVLVAGGDKHIYDKLDQNLEAEVKLISKEIEEKYFLKIIASIKEKLEANRSINVTIVYENARYKDYSFISGFLKSVSKENPKFKGKTLGVDSFGIKNSEELINILKIEQNAVNTEVRYLKKQREIKEFKKLEVPTFSKRKEKIKEGGVYLITGGAGGLGLTFARYLSTIKNVKLILVGRSKLTSQKEKNISQISGAEYFQCDIANEKKLKVIIDKTIETHQKLDGIIHSAGVAEDVDEAFSKSKTNIRKVLLPKVKGTRNLDEVTKDLNLDFIVLFSSISGLIGDLGLADYSSANAFLDSYAIYRNDLVKSGIRKGKTLSISWPIWNDGGMQMNSDYKSHLENQWGMLPLLNEEGTKAFHDVLNSSITQALVIYGREEKIAKNLYKKKNKEKRLETHVQVDKKSEKYLEERNHLEEKTTSRITTIIANISKLDVKNIAAGVAFSDYGFDSILNTKLCNELNGYYDLDIMPTLFFEYRTVETLIDYLLENHFEALQEKHQIFEKEPIPIPSIDKNSTQFKPFNRQRFLNKEKDVRSVYKNSNELQYIAIIGISGRFPGSPDLKTFWENIRDNKDLITEVPKDRWDWNSYYGDPQKEKGKTKQKWGGFIEDMDKFDSLFFNISPREAELMDPQQRITLEAVYGALEDASISRTAIRGSNTGVFIGVSSNDYSRLIHQHTNDATHVQSSTGSAHSILVNRISYLLDINGPSEPIDTACSSSLVAIHKAVENIRFGNCDMAIAGGVNAILTPEITLSLSQSGMLSEEGRCKTFDQSANGYVRSEGVGVVILKSLNQAEADGNHIYGIIRGSSQNHGGKANTLTSPNPVAQKELLLKAYQSSGIDPRDVSYLEASGAGTPLGDPIEAQGLKSAFKELYEDQDLKLPKKPYCGIGCIKTNIGNLEMASGVAGVIKVLLSLKHKTLPGNVHLQNPNEYLKLENTPFYLQKETKEWITKDNKPRIAGVSSFGFGGVNAHIIIEEYLPKKRAPYKSSSPVAILLSAKNKERLKEQVINLSAYIESNTDIDLYDIAYTLQIGREAMVERFAFIASDKEEVKNHLQKYTAGDTEGCYLGNIKKDKSGFRLTGNARKNHIDTALKNKELESLVKLWVAGIAIDWDLLYAANKPNKISLPTYPFAKERHWITKVETSNVPHDTKNTIDELIEMIMSNSSFESVDDFIAQIPNENLDDLISVFETSAH